MWNKWKKKLKKARTTTNRIRNMWNRLFDWKLERKANENNGKKKIRVGRQKSTIAVTILAFHIRFMRHNHCHRNTRDDSKTIFRPIFAHWAFTSICIPKTSLSPLQKNMDQFENKLCRWKRNNYQLWSFTKAINIRESVLFTICKDDTTRNSFSWPAPFMFYPHRFISEISENFSDFQAR